MKAELSADGAIVLRAPANAAVVVRRIPGARHDAKRQVWLLPLSWATCVTARGVLGDQLEVGPRLAKWARRELVDRIEPSLAFRDARDIPSNSLLARILDEIETA